MEGPMSAKKQTLHIRLPQRADAVAGPEPLSGEPPAAEPMPDPRTVSQDPVLKAK